MPRQNKRGGGSMFWQDSMYFAKLKGSPNGVKWPVKVLEEFEEPGYVKVFCRCDNEEFIVAVDNLESFPNEELEKKCLALLKKKPATRQCFQEDIVWAWGELGSSKGPPTKKAHVVTCKPTEKNIDTTEKVDTSNTCEKENVPSKKKAQFLNCKEKTDAVPSKKKAPKRKEPSKKNMDTTEKADTSNMCDEENGPPTKKAHVVTCKPTEKNMDSTEKVDTSNTCEKENVPSKKKAQFLNCKEKTDAVPSKKKAPKRKEPSKKNMDTTEKADTSNMCDEENGPPTKKAHVVTCKPTEKNIDTTEKVDTSNTCEKENVPSKKKAQFLNCKEKTDAVPSKKKAPKRKEPSKKNMDTTEKADTSNMCDEENGPSKKKAEGIDCKENTDTSIIKKQTELAKKNMVTSEKIDTGIPCDTEYGPSRNTAQVFTNKEKTGINIMKELVVPTEKNLDPTEKFDPNDFCDRENSPVIDFLTNGTLDNEFGCDDSILIEIVADSELSDLHENIPDLKTFLEEEAEYFSSEHPSDSEGTFKVGTEETVSRKYATKNRLMDTDDVSEDNQDENDVDENIIEHDVDSSEAYPFKDGIEETVSRKYATKNSLIDTDDVREDNQDEDNVDENIIVHDVDNSEAYPFKDGIEETVSRKYATQNSLIDTDDVREDNQDEDNVDENIIVHDVDSSEVYPFKDGIEKTVSRKCDTKNKLIDTDDVSEDNQDEDNVDENIIVHDVDNSVAYPFKDGIEKTVSRKFTTKNRLIDTDDVSEDNQDEDNVDENIIVHDVNNSEVYPFKDGIEETVSRKYPTENSLIDEGDASEDNQDGLDENIIVRDEDVPEIYVKKVTKSQNTLKGEKKKNDRDYTSYHPCPFCPDEKRMWSNFAQHVFRRHKQEQAVKKISEEEDLRKRSNLIAQLRRRADHDHNVKVEASGKGEIILGRRFSKGSFSVKGYGPCPRCFEWLKTAGFLRHMKYCPAESKCKETLKCLFIESSVLTGRLNNIASPALVNEVFAIMKHDTVGKAAQSDSLIITIGNRWMEKLMGNEINRKYYTSSIMRLAARF